MRTFTFAAGAAIGYVLGARAGREKYRQIVDGARTLSQKPYVQQTQSKIKDFVGQGTAVVTDKLGTGSDDPVGTSASLDSAPTVAATRSTAKKTAAAAPAEVTDNAF